MKLPTRLHSISPARLAQLGRHPLFRRLNPRELRAVDRLGRTVDVGPGHVFVRQGQEGRHFYVLLEGEATVWRDGVVVARLRAGDYCGELALLTEEPRDATVIAATPMQVLAFDEVAFSGLLNEVPEMIHELLQRT